MLANIPSFGRNPRGSSDFLAYPVPRACMHVLGTGVPRCLGVPRSASSPEAAQALGCSLIPGLRISFGRVTCMARAAAVPGLWTLDFLLLRSACVWVWVVLGLGFRLRPAGPGWGLGWVCLGTGCGFALPFPAGVCGVCGWTWASACFPPFLVQAFGRAWLCACSACSPPFAARMCGVGVCAWAWASAAPRHSWARCLGVCLFVCASRPVACTSWLGVRCGGVCRGLGCSRAPPLLAGVLGRVCVFVRAPLVPRPSCLVCVCVGLGFVCSLVFSWDGCWGARDLLCPPRLFPVTFRGAACGVGVCGCGRGCSLSPPSVPCGFSFFCFLPGGVSSRVVWGLCGVRRCVLGPGLQPGPATPGWGVGACVCSCARPACTLPFLAGVFGVGVCVGLGFLLCPATLGWGVGVCVRSCLCPACTPPLLAGGVWVYGFGFRLLPGFLLTFVLGGA